MNLQQLSALRPLMGQSIRSTAIAIPTGKNKIIRAIRPVSTQRSDMVNFIISGKLLSAPVALALLPLELNLNVLSRIRSTRTHHKGTAATYMCPVVIPMQVTITALVLPELWSRLMQSALWQPSPFMLFIVTSRLRIRMRPITMSPLALPLINLDSLPRISQDGTLVIAVLTRRNYTIEPCSASVKILGGRGVCLSTHSTGFRIDLFNRSRLDVLLDTDLTPITQSIALILFVIKEVLSGSRFYFPALCASLKAFRKHLTYLAARRRKTFLTPVVEMIFTAIMDTEVFWRRWFDFLALCATLVTFWQLGRFWSPSCQPTSSVKTLPTTVAQQIRSSSIDGEVDRCCREKLLASRTPLHRGIVRGYGISHLLNRLYLVAFSSGVAKAVRRTARSCGVITPSLDNTSIIPFFPIDVKAESEVPA